MSMSRNCLQAYMGRDLIMMIQNGNDTQEEAFDQYALYDLITASNALATLSMFSRLSPLTLILPVPGR